MNPSYKITSSDVVTSLEWWRQTNDKRAYSSLYYSEGPILKNRREIDRLYTEIETTKDAKQKLALTGKFLELQLKLKTQESLFEKILNLKRKGVADQLVGKKTEFLNKFEKLKKNFASSLAPCLEPIHYAMPLFLLFRLFIKDRIELYAKYNPYDLTYEEQLDQITGHLCNIRCSSDNEKVEQGIESCLAFVKSLEEALLAADDQIQSEHKLWDFWKEVIQEPEFLDFKVFSFTDQPLIITRDQIIHLHIINYSQLLTDLPLVKARILSLLDACHPGIPIEYFLGCPLTPGETIPEAEELRKCVITQIEKVSSLVAKMLSPDQFQFRDFNESYEELGEILGEFSNLFSNLRYLLEHVERSSALQRREIARKLSEDPDLEEKKLANLQIYQQIHNLNDSFIVYPYAQLESYRTAIKTDQARRGTFSPVTLAKTGLLMPPQMKSSYAHDFHNKELAEKAELLCLELQKKKTPCAKHALLYIKYIQGILHSHIRLSDYRGFVHLTVLLIESCYYALEQTAGDLAKEQQDFHGLVRRYQALRIPLPSLIKELDFAPHWIHYLYHEMASFQAITTIKSKRPPLLLTHLYNCLEVTNQQNAEKLLETAQDYVTRTLNTLIDCYQIKLKESRDGGPKEVLQTCAHPISVEPFLRLRRSLSPELSQQEKNLYLQMNLSLDLFMQSVKHLNETNDPILFAAMIHKASECLYRYFKQLLLVLHRNQFTGPAPRDLSVIDLYKMCLGPQPRVNELFAQFNRSGRYPYTHTENCRLHALHKDAIALMETPSLDFGFSTKDKAKLTSNEIRKKLGGAYLDALELIIPLLQS